MLVSEEEIWWFTAGFASAAAKLNIGPFSVDAITEEFNQVERNPQVSPTDQKRENFKSLLRSKDVEWLRVHTQNGPTEMDLLFSGCASPEEYGALVNEIIESKMDADPTLKGDVARIMLCITEGRALAVQTAVALRENADKLAYMIKQYDRIEVILRDRVR